MDTTLAPTQVPGADAQADSNQPTGSAQGPAEASFKCTRDFGPDVNDPRTITARPDSEMPRGYREHVVFPRA